MLNRSPGKNSFKPISEHYSIDIELHENDKKIFVKFLDDADASGETMKVDNAADLVKSICDNDLNTVLPVFWKVACILTTIPATSCSAERSFSGLRRMKTYLRILWGKTG